MHSLVVIQKYAKYMIAVMLLQFFSTNFGGHQLHLGESEQEDVNHSHLVFSALVDICDKNDVDSLFAVADHQHATNDNTQNQSYELCLDCQCHGGSATAIGIVANLLPSIPFSESPKTFIEDYLPPESRLSYRPPIA
ncbi:hypothetical protein ACFL6Z_03140 [Pseudomonadota bacterium]